MSFLLLVDKESIRASFKSGFPCNKKKGNKIFTFSLLIKQNQNECHKIVSVKINK